MLISLHASGISHVCKNYLKSGDIDHIAYRVRLGGVKTVAASLKRLPGYQFSDCYTIGTENAEYIELFHGFTGFFNKGNVGDLMRSKKGFNE